jgi:uroporphyrinogen-III synthase
MVSILSTKMLDSSWIEEAAHAGISVDCVQFIRINSVVTEELSDTIKKIAEEKRTVVFTSANAVNIVSDISGNIQPHWDVFCISGITLDAVNNHFSSVKVIATADNSASLAGKIIEAGVSHEVVFFCGKRNTGDIVNILSGADIPVREIAVYETNPSPVKVKQSYDGIMFFSPSGVDSYFSLNQTNDNAVFFTIGITTASALKQFSNPVIASDTPDINGMISKIASYYKL